MNPRAPREYAAVPGEQVDALLRFRAGGHDRSLRSGGATWDYAVYGRGKRVVVFLPGGFATADMWLRPMLALERKYRMISVAASLSVFDPQRFCSAVLEILDTEGVESLALVGGSYGGGLAQYLIPRIAPRLEGAVLSHCAPVNRPAGQKMRRLYQLGRWLPRAAFDAQWESLSNRSGPRGLEWSAYAEAYFGEVGNRVDKDVILRFLKETGRAAEMASFGTVTGPPILILSSRDDPISFPELEQLRTRYPDAATHVFETGGHATLLYRPEAYVAALEPFLDSLGKSSPTPG